MLVGGGGERGGERKTQKKLEEAVQGTGSYGSGYVSRRWVPEK